ncbi:PH domain-containing protein [Bacillus sp. FJAT-49736]|uniref:PH domain-containing protein n=1 Tax=Bacillus sp. FJAT-49736 TaxID=2833582 RepID=UPI001BC939F1|nr:PH domain-containing protein [Bacillus sp. FJAT-49736]MBS4175482.1 PH domain-containing protein [Bacillus sp. FJAT-49736]
MKIPVPQNRISKRALAVWRISGLISFIIVGIIIAGILFSLDFFLPLSRWWYVLGVIILILYFILKVAVIPSIRWKVWRYEVRDKEVELQHGVFVISRTLIPMVRVQHVDTVQGPLLRKYRLATLLISTAATVHHIPAIDIDEADQLRHSISSLAKVDEDDV